MSKVENCVTIKDIELPMLPDIKISKYSYLLYGNPYGEEDVYKLMQDYATAATEPLLVRIADLQEQIACVRQALPEQWRDSVPSVAVSTLVAELEGARKQAYQDGLRDAAEKIEQQHHWITAPGGAALIYAMLTASQREQK